MLVHHATSWTCCIVFLHFASHMQNASTEKAIPQTHQALPGDMLRVLDAKAMSLLWRVFQATGLPWRLHGLRLAIECTRTTNQKAHSVTNGISVAKVCSYITCFVHSRLVSIGCTTSSFARFIRTIHARAMSKIIVRKMTTECAIMGSTR